MTFQPGPIQVIHDFFSTKEEVLEDIKKLDLWPKVYVSERMEELPPHWHDLDNYGYVMESRSYMINEENEKIPLGLGGKLYIPSGAIHAEGKAEEGMFYIAGISEPAYLLERLTLLDPKKNPLNKSK